VVPIDKSVYCPLDDSPSWKIAKAMGQKFLYFKQINDDGCYVCSFSESSPTGDYFADKDLVLYEEEKQPEVAKSHVFTGKELLKLLNSGLIRENDEFYISKLR
jgi:hypothetical protein